jgi:hypothetical protein
MSAALSTTEVYDGLRPVGTIQRRPRGFRAIDPDGRRLGDFAQERDAMRALASQGRDTRGRP